MYLVTSLHHCAVERSRVRRVQVGARREIIGKRQIPFGTPTSPTEGAVASQRHLTKVPIYPAADAKEWVSSAFLLLTVCEYC